LITIKYTTIFMRKLRKRHKFKSSEPNNNMFLFFGGKKKYKSKTTKVKKDVDVKQIFIKAKSLKETDVDYKDIFNPGEVAEYELIIVNNSEKEYVGKLRVYYKPKKRDDPIGRYINLVEEDVVVGPQDNYRVPVSFSIPEDLETGSSYKTMMFEAVFDAEEDVRKTWLIKVCKKGREGISSVLEEWV